MRIDLPFLLRVGCTGHRDLPDSAVLREAMGLCLNLARSLATGAESLADALGRDMGLDRLATMNPTPPGGPRVVLEAVSSLAEGADRFLAHSVLDEPEGRLHAILPCGRQCYGATFASDESREEFADLLSLALSISRPLRGEPGPDAYMAAGKQVLRRSDVLVAVWDGKSASGQGGTAEVVELARRKGGPLIVLSVDRDTGLPVAVRVEGDNEPWETLQGEYADLTDFLAAPVDSEKAKAAAGRRKEELIAKAVASGVDLEGMVGFWEVSNAVFAKADQLAKSCQAGFYRAAVSMAWLSVLAVLVAGGQSLFRLPSETVLLETAAMLAILFILKLEGWRRWHERWHDARYLVERLRLDEVLAAGGRCGGEEKGRLYLELYGLGDWVDRVMAWLGGLAPLSCPLPEKLKHFVSAAWVNDQIAYHDKSSLREHARFKGLETASRVIFCTVVGASILHAFHLAPHVVDDWLSLLAVTLPAGGAALATVKALREHHRLALRSEYMGKALKGLRDALDEAESREETLAILDALARAAALENADWRALVRFRNLEIGG